MQVVVWLKSFLWCRYPDLESDMKRCLVHIPSLAENALAVLRGERVAKVYRSEEYDDPSKINDEQRPSKLREWLLSAITPQHPPKPGTAIRQYLKKWYRYRR